MKDIIIIRDGENYHLFLGDTGVWLNADEMNRLQVAVSQFKAEQKKPETYEAGRFYTFEHEDGQRYIALLVEDDGGEALRFGEHIKWIPKRRDSKLAKYSNAPLVVEKHSCSCFFIADEDDMHLFCNRKIEYLMAKANRFKLYQKVLVRDYEDEYWFPAIFVKYNKEKEMPYHCFLLDTGASTDFRFCEPYEGNESAAYDDKEILPF